MTPDPATVDHATADPNATAAPTAAAEATPPPDVPGYEVIAELGRGGMGVVYHARQLALNRPVALKMVLAGMHAAADDLVRFLHEAELLARVRHPNVVAIHEVGRHGGLPYFALEYCPGGTLAARLAAGPMLPPDAARLTATLARAVQAAHDVGVVHRDLKPGNVLLDAAGTPKLADFGLARFAELTRHLTQTGQVMGTPSYMAPEQAAGRSDVGPLADVYALGAMLYAFLTGRPPHQGATPRETVQQVLTDDPAAPRSLVPGLPRDLETIALKALHRKPGRRYASATAMADDLGWWLAGETVLARPAGRVEKAVKWTRRRPAAAALVAGGTMGFAAFVAFLVAFNAQLNEKQVELDVAWEQQKMDKAALATRQADLFRAVVAARKRASEYSLTTAQTYWENGRSSLAREALDAVAPDDRHWVWNYLRRAYDPGVPIPMVEDAGPHGERSPDCQRLAVIDGNNVLIRDTTTDQEIVTLRGHPGEVDVKAWSPDGTRIATFSADQTVRVWDTATGRESAKLIIQAGPSARPHEFLSFHMVALS